MDNNNYAVMLDFKRFLDEEGSSVVKDLLAIDVTRFPADIGFSSHNQNMLMVENFTTMNQRLTDIYHGLTDFSQILRRDTVQTYLYPC